MGKLANRVAVVTGGGTGIGRSIALTFAREGARVVISGRTLSSLEKVAQEIKAIGGTVRVVPADVTVKLQVQNMVKQAVDEFGKIDILVNNAGAFIRGLILDMPEEDWDTVINVNLKGTFLCIQAAAKYMLEQKYGRIINLSSIAGLRCTRATVAAYCASKAGIDLLTRAATLELTPYGINVNSIAPGSIDTDIYKQATPAQIEEWLAGAGKVPMGRLGTPQEIANAALFLASEDSAFISGHVLVVDGGRDAKMA